MNTGSDDTALLRTLQGTKRGANTETDIPGVAAVAAWSEADASVNGGDDHVVANAEAA